jgi:hypothetical protein
MLDRAIVLGILMFACSGRAEREYVLEYSAGRPAIRGHYVGEIDAVHAGNSAVADVPGAASGGINFVFGPAPLDMKFIGGPHEKVGVWRTWYASGRLEMEGVYNEGLRHGV